jgi:hypothetical protein
MQRHLTPLVALMVLAAASAATPAAAQSSFVDLEIGYQWVDVTGNEDMYRTQLNQEDGFVLNDLTVSLLGAENGVFDRFRIDASGFGGNPAGKFRLTSDLRDAYSLRLDYQQYEHFSALPRWANPFVDDGIIPGQHTWDRDRHMLDVELEILPGRVVTPILGYRFNQIDGPRTTTYHVGQDEFVLDSDLEETEEEFRVGLAFLAGRWRGAVIQGWREFESEDNARLAAGAGGGNNSREVLGVDVSADSIDRTVRTEAETPVTSAYVAGGFGDHVRVDASYVRADWEGDTALDETSSGNMVSYRISRFFSSLEQSVESRTENPSWRGGLRLGFDLGSKVVLDVGYENRHRELEGWALISSLYLDTLNFSGADPRDITELVEVDNGYEREDEILDATLRVQDVGPFHAWAGYATRDIDLVVNEDAAQILLPIGQEGSFERSVDSVDVGAGLVFTGFKLLVDYRVDDGDMAILRTDFRDRTRLRGRVDINPVRWFRLLGTYETISNENDDPNIVLDADTDHYAVDLELVPVEQLVIRGAWDRYETESSILYRRPQDFGIEPSLHAEDAELIEGSILWNGNRFHLTGGYSTLENEGSLPFQLDRIFGRLAVDFTDAWGFAVEYDNHEYTESAFTLADFEAERWGVFLRWHP